MRTLGERSEFRRRDRCKRVQASLRPDEAIVALNQFEIELAVWVIRKRTASTSSMRPMPRVDAQRLVARQQDEIWQ